MNYFFFCRSRRMLPQSQEFLDNLSPIILLGFVCVQKLKFLDSIQRKRWFHWYFRVIASPFFMIHALRQFFSCVQSLWNSLKAQPKVTKISKMVKKKGSPLQNPSITRGGNKVCLNPSIFAFYGKSWTTFQFFQMQIISVRNDYINSCIFFFCENTKTK